MSERAEIGRKAALMLASRISAPRWSPLPHQVPPPGDWYGWLLLAGRGAGKTDACAEYVKNHVAGPPCIPGPMPHLISIIAPTQGDAVRACVQGVSGILAHDSTAKMVTAAGGTAVKWANGSRANILGANSPEDVERLRAAGNSCAAWMEELAAWRYLDDAFDQLRFGLRSGPRPHWIASTTPKPRPLIKKLQAGEIRGVVSTHATMYDNPHLPQHIRDALEESYAGTQLGAQELFGRLIEEDENALWSRAVIESARVSEVPDLSRISVGVDPSGGAGEQGIVVVGKTRGNQLVSKSRGFVLADVSCRLRPEAWAERAVQAAVDWQADEIVAETNYGGDMCVATLRTASENMGVPIPIRRVTATRGKAVRAQPVAALTAQGRFHFAGVFEELEEQLCTWYPEIGWSPDRLDAMVWPAWHMRLVGTVSSGQGRMGSQLAGRKIT